MIRLLGRQLHSKTFLEYVREPKSMDQISMNTSFGILRMQTTRYTFRTVIPRLCLIQQNWPLTLLLVLRGPSIFFQRVNFQQIMVDTRCKNTSIASSWIFQINQQTSREFKQTSLDILGFLIIMEMYLNMMVRSGSNGEVMQSKFKDHLCGERNWMRKMEIELRYTKLSLMVMLDRFSTHNVFG